MNKIMITGNLTREPEMRVIPSGANVCSFTVAVNRRVGQGEKATDYYNISAWRGLADVCIKYLHKGSKVAVVGNLNPRSYEDKDGMPRISLDIQADEVEFMSSRSDAPAQRAPNTYGNVPAGMTKIADDDLPF